jgi:hypothetical protein
MSGSDNKNTSSPSAQPGQGSLVTAIEKILKDIDPELMAKVDPKVAKLALGAIAASLPEFDRNNSAAKEGPPSTPMGKAINNKTMLS